MPADCEVPIGARPCGVLAASRCGGCIRALCPSHQSWMGLCTDCYGARTDLHCAICELPHQNTCIDCGAKVCSQHTVHEQRAVSIGPTVEVFKPVSTGRCTQCRDAADVARLNEGLAVQMAEQGLAPFPALTRQDLGLRGSEALPVPGTTGIRFDGVYEHRVSYPARYSDVIRFLPDGRMFQINTDIGGAARIAPRIHVDRESTPTHISQGRVMWPTPSSGAGIEYQGWTDTNGNLALESFAHQGGLRKRTAALYRFVPVAALPDAAAGHGRAARLSDRQQYKMIELGNRLARVRAARTRLVGIWGDPSGPAAVVGRESRSTERARARGRRQIEALAAEEAVVMDRMDRLRGF